MRTTEAVWSIVLTAALAGGAANGEVGCAGVRRGRWRRRRRDLTSGIPVSVGTRPSTAAAPHALSPAGRAPGVRSS
jgi:hypothetical protein